MSYFLMMCEAPIHENDFDKQTHINTNDDDAEVKNTRFDDKLISQLYLHLIDQGFKTTAVALLHEADNLGFSILQAQYLKDSNVKKSCDMIMNEFRQGNGEKFLKMWNEFIPVNITETTDYKILTLKLYVHFAILPIRIQLHQQNSKSYVHILKMLNNFCAIHNLEGNSKDLKENCIKILLRNSMKQLQDYLESKQVKEFTIQTGFYNYINFLSLPHTSQPENSPLFTDIFKIEWIYDLTKELETFFLKYWQYKSTLSIATSTSDLLFTSDKQSETDLFSSTVMCTEKLPEGQPDVTFKLFNIHTTPSDSARSDLKNSDDHSIVTDVDEIVGNDRVISMVINDNEIEERISYSKHSCAQETQTYESCGSDIESFSRASEPLLSRAVNIINLRSVVRQPELSEQYNDELALTKSNLFNVHANYQKLKMRFYKLHTEYFKLREVAGELTMAVENFALKQPVDLPSIVESCRNIYPDLFNSNVEADSELKIESDGDWQGKELTREITERILINTPLSPRLLDFKKIKIHLINGNIRTKLLLLQALRRKITLSLPGDRDDTMHEYTNSDLLGLYGHLVSANGEPILPHILAPPDDTVTSNALHQSAARLLNAFASMRCGRDYLSIGPSVLNVIVKYLGSKNYEAVDALTCDMLIATLQKQSLRRQQRTYIIEAGLTEWLIHHLNNESCRMGSYRLEYASALLMNLSLEKQARLKASSIASLVISTLTTLLSSDGISALPYVNGALKNFLFDDVINEEAKKVDLASVLAYHGRQNTREMRIHFYHTLKVHKRLYEESECEASDEDNDGVDVLEDELEEEDPVVAENGELSGEMLLTMCYSLSKTSSLDKIDWTPKKPIEVICPRNPDWDLSQRRLSPSAFKLKRNNVRVKPIDAEYLREDRKKLKIKNFVCDPTVKRQERKASLQGALYYDIEKNSDTTVISSFSDRSFDERSVPASKNIQGVRVEKLANKRSQFELNEIKDSESRCFRFAGSELSVPSTENKDSAVCLFTNAKSKESSKMFVSSETSINSAGDNIHETADKLSSIASLNETIVPSEQQVITRATPVDEDAFAAKPKLLRTPPQSANGESRNKIRRKPHPKSVTMK